MKKISIFALIFVALALGGCTRTINISPDENAFKRGDAPMVNKAVAYYISDEDRAKKVVTPGGGGDKVTYAPYAELESALRHVLKTRYSDVYLLKSPDDKAYLAEKKISYVFIPRITTDSSSSSALTWPPTDFSINLECQAMDTIGKPVWQTSIEGKGQASFSEFKSNFGLAAHRAAEDAFTQLQRQLIEAKALH
jgi:hypothetical protein